MAAIEKLARGAVPDTLPEIHVCQSGTCHSRGGEVAMVEIEELARAMRGSCVVRATGCLGYCSQGPAALVKKQAEIRDPSDPFRPPVQRIHVKISSMEASARVVEDATGKKPPIELETEKFADLRLTRTRQHARSVFHWNKALRGLAAQVVRQPELKREFEELLTLAGFGGSGAECTTMPDAIANYSQWSVDEVTPVSK